MVRVSRRALLASLAGTTAMSGCSRVLGGSGPEPVRVLGAGSLQNALLALDSRVSVPVEVEARGSAVAARLVAEGTRDPDVLALADTALFESVLDPDWYARFATNELVLAYDPDGEAGGRLREADRWFEPIIAGEVTLGRTDPDLDPLGYRTLFALELAAEYYDRPDLPETVRSESDVYPETSLLARLDTGAIGAAVVYRNMALDHGHETVGLPGAIDLSDPEHADRYGTVSYRLPDGTRVTGSVIEYGVTFRRRRPAVERVYEELISGDLLEEYGFARPPGYPTFEGDVPDAVR